LVLDGLEPLQHPPGPMEGQLKDSGLSALLKGLAAQNAGLCVVTTREKVDDIKQHYGRTADDLELIRLTDLAGAALLHYAGAIRAGAKLITPDDKELQATSREVRGHGLTLQLLGRYLRLVEDGDIRKRDTVRLADADEQYQNDATRPYGHAFKAMEAYEKWFAGEGEKGLRQLAILRLLGLFDRPASKNCLDALRAAPVIAGLTEALVRLNPREWKLALSRLEEINLLAVQDDGSVDCHPLLREYFATQLRQQHPEAWRAAHRRLYGHLCATTKDLPQPTLEDLQPLYQAVAHGCQAGIQEEAGYMVYHYRIQRGQENYSTAKLGAYGSDLGAIACFFEQLWSRVSPAVTEATQAWLLNQAAYGLCALGRLTEALEPMRGSLEMGVKQGNWKSAAIRAGTLSGLELTLGEVAGAVGDAEQSVSYADGGGDAFLRMGLRTTHADALHQAGRRAEAEARFREAEQMQAERQPDYPLLYYLQGFRYCDLLLTEAECAAWRVICSGGLRPPEDGDAHRATLQDVSERVATIFEWRDLPKWDPAYDALVDIARDHLTLGRAALYAAILEGSSLDPCHAPLQDAVAGLRRAGEQQYLPHGLLTRAWLRSLEGRRAGHEGAQSDLDEAWEIAERGPMKLFLADIHPHRARLFFREAEYPWGSPAADLAAARELIKKCGYGRRKEELEDAERAIGGGT
jgi:hypothetical protein